MAVTTPIATPFNAQTTVAVLCLFVCHCQAEIAREVQRLAGGGDSDDQCVPDDRRAYSANIATNAYYGQLAFAWPNWGEDLLQQQRRRCLRARPRSGHTLWKLSTDTVGS